MLGAPEHDRHPDGQVARSPATRRSLATFLVAVALVGCTGGSAGRAGPGDPAPALAGTTLEGAALDLHALRGRPVIVNFWASWCIPCRNEFPLFRDELAAHATDGLELVGVVFKDDDAAARAFIVQFGASWPSLTDPNGALATAWRVVAPPQTYFVDRDGIIRSRQIGEVTQADLERQLGAILK